MKPIYASIFFTLLVIAFVSFVGLEQVSAQAKPDKFDEQQLEFFESKVRPILVERCYECHGPESKPIEGSLSIGSRKALMNGGDTGPAIVPGDAEKSLLIDAINYGDVYEMPPDTKMPAEEIKILTDWVNMGAPWPADSDVEIKTTEEFDIQKRKAAHWCWQPIRNPKIPSVKQTDWVIDPIDNFILHGIEAAGLTPANKADRRTVIRRAYFDLTGLPPTPEQVKAFVDDKSPNAFEAVVDELLASPHFGERWARHWLDLQRYAETGGHEFDYAIPYAHYYRDYLIRAFNEDVSYKQFIHEHIAGDLLKNPREHKTELYNESLLATGSWYLGEAKHGAVDSRLEEARTIDNQIDVMSKTFLGLTVACARCHDHKFDAISTEDYYALSGFLQSTRRQDAMLDPGKKIESAFNEITKLHELGKESAKLLGKQFENPDREQVSRYFDAAIEILRKDKRWFSSEKSRLEGERLKKISASGGDARTQKIKRTKKFNWSGDQQFWWRQGKTGDTLILEFKLSDVTIPGEYELLGNFTKARDYGTANIYLNDKLVKKEFDFYSADLGTTGPISLGKHPLKQSNQIKLELTARNMDAAAGNMVGVDYLEIVPTPFDASAKDALLVETARAKNVDPEKLLALTIHLASDKVRSKSHPLHVAYEATKMEKPVGANFFEQLSKRIDAQSKQYEKWTKDSTVFADFSNGIPDDWFQTGFAFGSENYKANDSEFSADTSGIKKLDTITSGRFGNKFFGVLRSPTFKIEKGQIHYRYKGTGGTFRLVINNFRMDEANGLLYKGCISPVKANPNFAWHLQAGDIKNHIGQYAHLELIDHIDGSFEIDEIRISNGARPVDPPSKLMTDLASSKFDSQGSFCSALANSVCDQLKARSAELTNDVIAANLVSVFGSPNPRNDKNASNWKSQKTSTVFVSTNNNSSLSVDSGSKAIATLESIQERIAEINKGIPNPVFVHGMADGTSEDEFIMIRGNHKALGKVATRRFLSALSTRTLNPPDGSGRLLLAQKITAPNNPLTTRVVVNRIWHHLTGVGIVKSVDNFGVLGSKPTHPELLDYLATDFAKHQWSMKHTIKKIMLTQTYQMDSKTNPAAQTIDPDNKLLHRGRIRRLQGEAIRDSMLAISGRLDKKMFGKPVPIHLTPFMNGRGRPRTSGPVDGDGRRSIYIAVRRNFLSPMMLAFDTPIPFNATGKRNQSNVPAQSLIMLNDPFVIGEAKRWGERLASQSDSMEDRINLIYETAFARQPTTQESSRSVTYIKTQAQELGVNEDQIMKNAGVWQDFCHAIFNVKEFIYVN